MDTVAPHTVTVAVQCNSMLLNLLVGLFVFCRATNMQGNLFRGHSIEFMRHSIRLFHIFKIYFGYNHSDFIWLPPYLFTEYSSCASPCIWCVFFAPLAFIAAAARARARVHDYVVFYSKKR